MIKSIPVAILIVVLLSPLAFCGEIIVAQETETYFFPNPDKKVEQDDGEFENTYDFTGNTITRIKVSNPKRGQPLSDDTKYVVDKKLISVSYSGDPYIRAVGYPGTDAIEILTFNSKYMQNIKSTGDYMIVTRYRIIERRQK
jgi:hypothetical protein